MRNWQIISSLLSEPAEELPHWKIYENTLGARSRKFIVAPTYISLFSEAHARDALSSKIVRCDKVKSKATKKNPWFEIEAEENGHDLEDCCLMMVQWMVTSEILRRF